MAGAVTGPDGVMWEIDHLGVGHVAIDQAAPVPVVVQPSLTDRRLDYDVRTDTLPVYVGSAAQGTATSAATWTIQKLTYDGGARLVRAETLVGAWDNRTTLGW